MFSLRNLSVLCVSVVDIDLITNPQLLIFAGSVPAKVRTCGLAFYTFTVHHL